jgi:dipeptide/tripeptide permease
MYYSVIPFGMKFFDKAKKFIRNKFSKPKEVLSEPGPVPLNKEISEFVITKLNGLIVNPTSIPTGLSKKQWRTALSVMVYAWDQGYREINLKSPRKQKIQRMKILLGFKLFVKYYQHIK